MLVRLRALLAERFALRTRTEQRPTDVYALTIARNDKRLGQQIRPSTINCEVAAAARKEALARGAQPTGPACGTSFAGGSGEVVLRKGAVTIDQMALVLAQHVGRTVVNDTGLTGRFDIELRIVDGTPQEIGASVFTAVQEQLGLKLESRRMVIPVVVIDHVERPTAN